MKKAIQLFFLLIITQACLPTLFPLYHSKDLLLIDGLTGSWSSSSESDKGYTWFFEPNPGAKDDDEEKNLYMITIASQADTVFYAGGILKLGESYYLDLYLPDFKTELPMAKDHLYPVHTIWKFDFKPNQVEISPFNSEWIRNMIKNNQVRIKHEQTDKGILITAGTNELQTFVRKYGSDERAFDKPKKLIKKI